MNKKIMLSIFAVLLIGMFLFSFTTAGQGIITKSISFITPLSSEANQIAVENGIDNIAVSQGQCENNQCQYHAFKSNVVDTDFYIPTIHEVIDTVATDNAKSSFLDNVLDRNNLTEQEQLQYDSIKVMKTINYTDLEIESLKEAKVAELFKQSIAYYTDRDGKITKVKTIQGNEMVFSK